MEKTFEVEPGLDVSNLSNRVYQHIKRLIMTGKLTGGERIPEQAIAEKLGVSRTPIREALRRLDEHGLVVIEPRRLTRVATVTLEDKMHLGQVRLELGVLAVRLLVERASDDDCDTLTSLAHACDEAAKAGDIATCFELDSQLHCAIADLCGNHYLAQLTRTIDYKVQLMRNIEPHSPEIVRQKISLHVPIVEAIRRRDGPMAEKLMRDHLTGYYTDDDLRHTGAAG
ncbi:MAG TPA: GntR family transcriptional regulator [Spirochaetia bacterium]